MKTEEEILKEKFGGHIGETKVYITDKDLLIAAMKQYAAQERNKAIDECIEIVLDELEGLANTREEMREQSSMVKALEKLKV